MAVNLWIHIKEYRFLLLTFTSIQSPFIYIVPTHRENFFFY